jgi:hypothetical protein
LAGLELTTCGLPRGCGAACHAAAARQVDLRPGVRGSCHRGALLGLVLGAARGPAGLPEDLACALHPHPQLAALAAAFAALAASPPAAAAGAGAAALSFRLPPGAEEEGGQGGASAAGECATACGGDGG